MTLSNDSLDLSFDADLATIPGLHYLPWIGRQFRVRHTKVLLVAESVYNWEPSSKTTTAAVESKDFCRTVVSEHGFFYKMEKPWPDIINSKIARPLERLLLGDPVTNKKRESLWESVAFHELVQRPMMSRGERPSSADYQLGGKVLVDLVKMLEVTSVIFLGTDPRKLIGITPHLVNGLQWHEKIGKSVPRTGMLSASSFVMIRHPSAYFRLSDWTTHLDKVHPEIRQSFDDIRRES